MNAKQLAKPDTAPLTYMDQGARRGVAAEDALLFGSTVMLVVNVVVYLPPVSHLFAETALTAGSARSLRKSRKVGRNPGANGSP